MGILTQAPELSGHGIDPVVTVWTFLSTEVRIFTPGTPPVSAQGMQGATKCRIPRASAVRRYRHRPSGRAYRIPADLTAEPLPPVTSGMKEYLLPLGILLYYHLSVAGVIQQPSAVVVRYILYGYPFSVFNYGVLNRSELHHCPSPAHAGPIPHG